MGGFLKQSTAAAIPFGPFLDKTDGVTLEVAAGIITSIDHATTGIFLSKNGGTGAIRHQGVTASVLDAYGMFLVTLDTTDTNTVGHLRVMMAEAATFLPVWDDFTVLPANVFDSLMGTDLLDVSVTAAAVADAVWDEAQSGHEAAGSFGELQWIGNDQEITANQFIGKSAAGNVLKTFNLTQDDVSTEWNPDKREAE